MPISIEYIRMRHWQFIKSNMSNSRALIDGKSKLASQINNEVTSRMTDLLEDLGNYDEQVKQASERVIKSVSRETQIAGYHS